MANDINIPFKVDDQPYTTQQVKSKDAATLASLQGIQNSLEVISAELKKLNKSTTEK